MKILFLLKKNYAYGTPYSSSTPKSGLLNSAQLTAEQLTKHLGLDTAIEICVDGNEIDKFVTLHKPSICVIEALWVTPAKFKELTAIHKKVKFVVRIHSKIPFLANEGNAISSIKEYIKIPNVIVSFNSRSTTSDFFFVMPGVPSFLPNIYSDDFKWYIENNYYNGIDIGCFGAIRPLKNQLLQAFAAIRFAEKYKTTLRFHVNSTRTEQGGDSVLNNLKALFADTRHELVEHLWMERKEFLELVSTMDLGMQVSFNESFNIVSADFTLQAIPIIVSESIEWMPEIAKANMLSAQSIYEKIREVVAERKRFVKKSQQSLAIYNSMAVKLWARFIKTI